MILNVTNDTDSSNQCLCNQSFPNVEEAFYHISRNGTQKKVRCNPEGMKFWISWIKWRWNILCCNQELQLLKAEYLYEKYKIKLKVYSELFN